MREMLDHDGPYLLDVVVPYTEHVLPFIPQEEVGDGDPDEVIASDYFEGTRGQGDTWTRGISEQGREAPLLLLDGLLAVSGWRLGAMHRVGSGPRHDVASAFVHRRTGGGLRWRVAGRCQFQVPGLRPSRYQVGT
jgi:hypothetical protein